MVCVQGIFIAFGWILLAIGLLLFIPVRFHLDGQITLSGGRGCIRVSWLFLSVRLWIRLLLPEEGTVYLERLDRKGAAKRAWRVGKRKKPKSPWEKVARQALHMREFQAKIHIGTGGAVCLNAYLCGALASALSTAGNLLWPGMAISVTGAPAWGAYTFRIAFKGIASVRPAHIIRERILNQE